MGRARPIRPNCLEQISDSKKDFDLIEWFKQKIGRSDMKSAVFGFICGVGGEDDHRQVDLAATGAKRPENSRAVEMRHQPIEQD